MSKTTCTAITILFMISLLTWNPCHLCHAQQKQFNAGHYYNWGMLAFNTGNYKLAVKHFDYSLALQPKSIDALMMRARSYMALKDFPRAIADFSSVLASSPQSREAFRERALAYQDMGQAAKAKSDLDKFFSSSGTVDLTLSDTSFWERDAAQHPKHDTTFYILYLLYHAQKQNEKATKAIVQAIALVPRAEYHLAKGQLLLAQNKKKDALTEMLLAKQNGLTSAYAHAGLAEGLVESQKYDLAMEEINKACQMDPKNSGYFELRADIFQYQKKLADALVSYTKALNLNPKSDSAYYSRALVYQEMDKFNEALDDNTKSLGIDPSFACAWHNRGAVHERLRQYKDAVRDYKNAIARTPSHANHYVSLAVLYDLTGQTKKAQDYFEKSLPLALREQKDEPEDADKWEGLTLIYSGLGSYDLALQAGENAIALGLDDPSDVYCAIAGVYGKTGKPELAEAAFAKALAGKGDRAFIYYLRGKFYQSQGKTDQSASDLKKATELGFRTPEASEVE